MTALFLQSLVKSIIFERNGRSVEYILCTLYGGWFPRNQQSFMQIQDAQNYPNAVLLVNKMTMLVVLWIMILASVDVNDKFAVQLQPDVEPEGISSKK
jgi:hypothetical protein